MRVLSALALLSIVVFSSFAAGDARAADPPAGYLAIQGDQFTLNGEVYRLKGTNYYPRDHMWADIWNSWDWQEMVTETAMIRALGMNSVRILVPYQHGGWNGANPPESRLKMLEDLVNLFGQQGIRSCVTLFDWETSFAAAGTQREQEHLSYLSAIVNRLKNNQYVFLWDAKNEPDHPANISGHEDWDKAPEQKAKIMNWLERMCNVMRALDPNHPVTAGMRLYPNTVDVLGFVDVACFHSYNSPITDSTQIPVIKSAMGASVKPILAEEFGWPTHPTPCDRDGTLIYDYTEAKQLENYQRELAAFEKHNIAGCMQWMTFDAKTYSSKPSDSFENYFGLWRYDYSLKPAGEYYRDHFAVKHFPVGMPPGPVRSLTAVPTADSVTLRWTNPSDSNFKRVLIRFSTDKHPQSPSEGTLLFEGSGVAGVEQSCVHSGLEDGGPTLYYTVFASDDQPLYSEPAYAQSRPVGTRGDRIGRARLLPEGTQVMLKAKIVTAAFGQENIIYISEPDRSAGIQVSITQPAPPLHSLVDVTGAMGRMLLNGRPSEARILNAHIVLLESGGIEFQPVAIRGLAVGGSAAGPTLPGVRDGTGLYNIGCLVRIHGRVSSKSGPYIWLDDGSGVPFAPQYGGIMVRTASVVAPVSLGDYVQVTGIARGSLPSGWTENRRLIQTRTVDDVIILAEAAQ